MNKLAPILTIVCLALIVGAWKFGPAQPAPITKWEYKSITLTLFTPNDPEVIQEIANDKEATKQWVEAEKKQVDEFEASMKKLGSEGWELVSIDNWSQALFEKINVRQRDAYFKRPLQ